ncbi:MAG: hypothetical protein JWN04_50 [Myxococcaceae bacterium]|nr:hypothetical protein [Myxococcaceae bacterium]
MGMNISSTSQSSELLRLEQLQALQKSGTTTSTSAPDSEIDVSSSVSISKPAQEFKKLAALQQSDPAKFKEVTEAISQQLSAAARQQTGAAADKLNDLATKFQQASDSGDMSSLQPSVHKGGGGHKHSGAAAAYAANTPPPPRPSDAVKSAMDSAFELIDQATGSSSSSSTS